MSELRPRPVLGLYVWRVVTLALAIGLPFFFNRIAAKEDRELHELASSGQTVEGVVTGFSGNGSQQVAYYTYVVDGREYTWNQNASRAPGIVGAPITVTYLARNPKIHAIGPPLTEAEIQERTSFSRHSVFGSLILFTIFFLINEFQLRRRRGGQADLVLSPRSAGLLIAFLIYAILMATQFDRDVRAVDEKAFGAHPFGLPCAVVVAIGITILYLPFFAVFHHASILAARARSERAAIGGLGAYIYLLRVGRLHPELKHSQRIVGFGFVYFLCIVGGWIAYTAYLGI